MPNKCHVSLAYKNEFSAILQAANDELLMDFRAVGLQNRIFCSFAGRGRRHDNGRVAMYCWGAMQVYGRLAGCVGRFVVRSKVAPFYNYFNFLTFFSKSFPEFEKREPYYIWRIYYAN